MHMSNTKLSFGPGVGELNAGAGSGGSTLMETSGLGAGYGDGDSSWSGTSQSLGVVVALSYATVASTSTPLLGLTSRFELVSILAIALPGAKTIATARASCHRGIVWLKWEATYVRTSSADTDTDSDLNDLL